MSEVMKTSIGNTFGARPHNHAVKSAKLYRCTGCDGKWYGVNLTDGNKIPLHFDRDYARAIQGSCPGSLQQVQD